MAKKDIDVMDVIFLVFIGVALLVMLVSALGRAQLRRECNAKGGAYIDGECLRVERIK